MTPPAATPTQLLSSRLAATPEQVWARVRHSGFIGRYLGAQLPAAELLPGATLRGWCRDGAPLTVNVTEARAPCSLSLHLSTGGSHSALRLAIAACAQGSRLTLLHEASAAPAPGAGAAARAAAPAAAGLAQQLAAAPPALLLAGPVDGAPAAAAARAYLAETAVLVGTLRAAMAPRQGYDSPAAGGFSLVQHLWHLADVEQFGWARRFERLLTRPAPRLPGVDGDRLALERRYQQRPWRAAAARFVRQRQRTLAALAQCDAAVLRRPVRFGGQPSSGAELLAALLAHDHEHRLAMAALWPPAPAARSRPSREGA
jgi:uncharacterized damage-inducible protein DinB